MLALCFGSVFRFLISSTTFTLLYYLLDVLSIFLSTAAKKKEELIKSHATFLFLDNFSGFETFCVNQSCFGAALTQGSILSKPVCFRFPVMQDSLENTDSLFQRSVFLF